MRYLLAATLVVVLAACSQTDPPSPDDASGASSTSPAGSAPVAATQPPRADEAIRIEPSSLPDCTPVEANVTWNVSNPSGDTFEVHVDEHGGELFAAGGATGESRTGPWAIPGKTLVLVDTASGEEIGRASIQGPSCD